MTANMGTIDRVVRITVAVLIIALYAFGYISGILAVALGVVAAAFLLTSAISWCPAYAPFGLSTRRRQAHGSR